MRLLFVTSNVPNFPDDGIKIVSFNLIRQLQKLYGYEIDLVVLTPDPVPSDLSHIEPYCRSIKILPIQNQGRLQKIINLFRLRPNQILMGYDPVAHRRFRTCINEKDYDFMYAMPVGVWQYIEEYRAVPKVLNTLDAHSLREARQFRAESFYSYKKYYSLFNYLKMSFYEKNKYINADLCILVSKYDMDYLITKNNRARFKVIPNGVDTDYFRLQDVPVHCSELSLVFTGDYFYRPNELAALYLYEEIYLPLKRDYPKLKLYIVGKNPTEQMKRNIDDENAVVTGLVPDVRPYLKSASVFVCPLSFGSGVKNKILEALAMQVPVVCSALSICGMYRLAENNLVKVAEHKADYIKYVKDLLDDSTKRRLVGERGRQFVVEEYSWQAVAVVFDKSVRCLLNRDEGNKKFISGVDIK